MRLHFSTSWIFQGWIIYLVFSLYTQKTISKSIQCAQNQYQKGSKCCMKCGPGYYVFAECTSSKETKCRKCDHGEYQPGWTEEKRCLHQRICDTGKGFMPRTENPVLEEPCRCLPSFQCSLINCEYCERSPTCPPGSGQEPDPESTNGRRICVPCKRGFFSQETTSEPCKQWTSCKALGRSEQQHGSPQSDAVCGPPVTGAQTSWVIVSVLSVITVLSLLILLLFCYKDKLKLLSVNLRSCVQNLKRTRIQQETLAPLYHSGARAVGVGAVGVPGDPNCTFCESTKLICKAPHSQTLGPLQPCPEVKVVLPCNGLTEASEQEEEVMSMRRKLRTEEGSEGSGEPEEVSEDEVEEKEEEEEEGGGEVSPLLAGSCACLVPLREPLEVGENEDCSQAVGHGNLGTCSCGGQERKRDEAVKGKEEAGEGVRRDSRGERADRDMANCHTGIGFVSSPSPPVLHTSTVGALSSPHRELCLPLSQAQTRPKLKLQRSEGPQVRQEEICGLPDTDSDSAEATAPNTVATAATFIASVSPITPTSPSVGDLYLEKTHEASAGEWSQGVSLRASGGNKLPSGSLELECPPESLQSQLAESAPTSGQVTGNHNTTFISSGQVMNFSGDVIVVYVSQTSGADEAGLDEGFGSPIQEQADDAAPRSFQSRLVTSGDSIYQNISQDGTLPVQEVMDEWAREK